MRPTYNKYCMDAKSQTCARVTDQRSVSARHHPDDDVRSVFDDALEEAWQSALWVNFQGSSAGESTSLSHCRPTVFKCRKEAEPSADCCCDLVQYE